MKKKCRREISFEKLWQFTAIASNTRSALENLHSLPKREADQILRKILRLENGLQGNIKRLQNADVGFRLRMGDYRVLFDVIGDKILVQKVGNRKDVYE